MKHTSFTSRGFSFAFHRLFFYLTVIFLPTQLGKHFWPSWSFVLGRRVDYLAPTLYITDIFIILMLVSWVLFEKNVRTLDKSTYHRVFPWIVVLGFVVGCNTLFSLRPMITIYAWLKIVEYAFFGYYIYKTRPRIDTHLLIIAVPLLYSSILAFLQFGFQHSVGGIFWLLGERTFDINTPGIARTAFCGLRISDIGFTHCTEVLRSYGTFPHPNVLAGFLVTGMLLLFEQWFVLNTKQKIVVSFVNCISFFALLLTFSRASLLIFFLLLLLFLWKHTRLPRGVYKGGLILVCVITLFLIYHLIQTHDESYVVRKQLAQSAVIEFMHSPLFGVGLGNFLVDLPRALPSRGIYYLQPVHNIYLLLLSELGLMGILFISYFTWYCVRTFLLWKNLWSFGVLALLGLLITGLFDHYMLTLQQGQLLFTFLGAIFLTNLGADPAS